MTQVITGIFFAIAVGFAVKTIFTKDKKTKNTGTGGGSTGGEDSSSDE